MAFEVYDLYVKLGVDSSGFDKGLADAKKKLGDFGNSAKKQTADAEKESTSLMGRLGSGLAGFGKTALGVAGEVAKTTAKVTAAVTAAAGAGVIALTKAAVASYGEYQQLAGGIETLFKGSSDKMMKYAETAYKTAGISKNRYMTIAIESSAAMINSLGGDTEKAAEYTNMAITDMSDNVNKMGTTFESLQNAYRGFSRGNFTMLDNLSLGFAGTKQGMQELLDKAKELSGIEYDISSYSDIVQAIHVVQQEMGITGTTAAEAAHTITGSLGSVKAAWQNLVTSLADPKADLGQLISDLVDTAEAAVKNLVPTIVNALEGIAQLIEKIVPIIGEKLPELIRSIVPSILRAATSVVRSLADALPTLIDMLAEEIPKVLNELLPVIIDGLTTLAQGIAKVLPKLAQVIADNVDVFVDGVVSIIGAIGQAFLDTFPILFPALVNIVVKTISKLADLFSKNANMIVGGILDIVTCIIDTLTDPKVLGTLIDATVTILEALMDALANNMDKVEQVIEVLVENTVDLLIECTPILLEGLLRLLWALIKGLGAALGEGFGELVIFLGQKGSEIIHGIAQFLADALWHVTEGLSSIMTNIIMWCYDAISSLAEKGRQIWNTLGETLTNYIGTFKETIQNFWNNIKQKFENVFSGIYDIGKNLMLGLWNGIKDFGGHVVNGVKNLGRSIVNGFTSIFQTHSPSRVMRKIGQYVVEGLGLGIEDEESGVVKNVKDFGLSIIEALEKTLQIHSPSKKAERDGKFFAQGFGIGFMKEIDNQDKMISGAIDDLGSTSQQNSQAADTWTSNQSQRVQQGLKGARGRFKLAGANAAARELMLNVAKADELLQASKSSIWGRSFAGEDVHLGVFPTGSQAGDVVTTSKAGAGTHGGGYGGGSYGGGYGGGGGYGIDNSKLDDIISMLRAIMEKDTTFTSDLILDNTKIGAVITSINADNTIRSGGYNNA